MERTANDGWPRLALVFTLAMTLFSLGSTTASAQEENAAFSVLPADKLRLSPGKPGTLTLVNGSDAAMTVRITSAILGEDGTLAAATLTPASPLTLPAGGIEQVDLTCDCGEEGYSGTVTVTATGANQPPSVRTIPVEPLEDAVPQPSPATTAWEFTTGVWGSSPKTSIPLLDECPADWREELVLSGSERFTRAEARCPGSEETASSATSPPVQTAQPPATSSTPPPPPPIPSPTTDPTAGSPSSSPAATDEQKVLTLTAEGVKPGIYKGELKIGDATVAITMTKTRPVWLAALLVLIGAVIAVLCTVSVTRNRPIAKLEARAKTSADNLFKEAKKNQIEGLEVRPTPLLQKLRDAPRLAPLLESDLNAARDQVSEREADIGLIPELADRRERLRTLLDETAAELSATPVWLASGKALKTSITPFKGQPSLDVLKSFASGLAALTETGALRVSLWCLLDGNLPSFEREGLLKSLHELETLTLDLTAAEDAETITALNPGASLRRVAGGVNAALRHEAPEPADRDIGVHQDARGATPSAPQILGIPFLTDIARWIPSISRVFSRTPNAILFALTALAALLAGYAAFYAGKPWGTPVDMLAAVVYGATTFVAALSLGTFFGKQEDAREEVAPPVVGAGSKK